MVFSGETQPTDNSLAGATYIAITPQPLIAGTTVKEYIVFNVVAQIKGARKDVVEILLANLEAEINSKVNTLLIPMNGQINDGSPFNYSISTLGFGSVFFNVFPRQVVAGTSNPDEVVFNVKIQINSCTRSKLINILKNLDVEIMNKVNELL